MNNKTELKAEFQTIIRGSLDELLTETRSSVALFSHTLWFENPLHTALLPNQIPNIAYLGKVAVCRFETIYEKLVLAAANSGLGNGVAHHQIYGIYKRGQSRRIYQILGHSLDAHYRRGVVLDWESAIKHVLKGRGTKLPVDFYFDIYVEDVIKNKRYIFELFKQAIPEHVLIENSKKKLLYLSTMEVRQEYEAYFVIPFGHREDDSWGYVGKWFDMRHDKIVLVGKEFWDMIGGEGTYEVLIDAINEVGSEYKAQIYREFLEDHSGL